MGRIRLFCLPCAGGGSSFYRRLGQFLAPDVELCAIDLKGHGMRPGEELSTRLEDALDDCWERMRGFGLDGPFALLGYSMGATIAYHLYFRLAGAGLRPRHVFFMANTPPYAPNDGVPSADLPDDAFLEEIAALGGLSEEVLARREFMDLLLPIVRADVRLEEGAQVLEPRPIECDMTVIYSDADYAGGNIEAWRACAQGSCDFHRFEGTHFFMLDHYAEVAEIINRTLVSQVRPSTGASRVRTASPSPTDDTSLRADD